MSIKPIFPSWGDDPSIPEIRKIRIVDTESKFCVLSFVKFCAADCLEKPFASWIASTQNERKNAKTAARCRAAVSRFR